MFDKYKLAKVLRYAFDSTAIAKRITDSESPFGFATIAHPAHDVKSTCHELACVYVALLRMPAELRIQGIERIPADHLYKELARSYDAFAFNLHRWSQGVSQLRQQKVYHAVFGIGDFQFSETMKTACSMVKKLEVESEAFLRNPAVEDPWKKAA